MVGCRLRREKVCKKVRSLLGSQSDQMSDLAECESHRHRDPRRGTNSSLIRTSSHAEGNSEQNQPVSLPRP